MSATSAEGQSRFILFEGSATAETFFELITRLCTSVEQEIFLIVDGHAIHRAKAVKSHLESLDHQMTLFSPQLNPDEWVWNYVKQRVAQTVVRSDQELKAELLFALRSLPRLPKRIRGFFRDPDCCYAA